MGIASDVWIKSPAPEPTDRHSDEWWIWYLRDTCPWCGQVAVRDDVCTVCLGRKSRPPSPWTSESNDSHLSLREPLRPLTSCPAEAPKEPGAVTSATPSSLPADGIDREAMLGTVDERAVAQVADKCAARVNADDQGVTAGETAHPPQGSSETLGRLGSTTKSAGSTPAAGTTKRRKRDTGQGSLF